jgi:hypothetical protein
MYDEAPLGGKIAGEHARRLLAHSTTLAKGCISGGF